MGQFCPSAGLTIEGIFSEGPSPMAGIKESRFEMPGVYTTMTTEYVQLSGYIPMRRAEKAARHDPV